MTEREKYVDEGWKDNVASEKTNQDKVPAQEDSLSKASAPETPAPQEEQPSPDDMQAMMFLNYVTSMAYQAMIFLGVVPNPMAGDKIEKDLDHAKFLIDTLMMLREKTKGNLTPPEEEFLNASVHELQMKYVESMKSDKGGA